MLLCCLSFSLKAPGKEVVIVCTLRHGHLTAELHCTALLGFWAACTPFQYPLALPSGGLLMQVCVCQQACCTYLHRQQVLE
jgi:hypothetical protein